MTNILETAQAYEPPQTKNIADLKKVSVNNEISTETFKTKEGDAFTLNLIEVEGVKYRVPVSIIAGIKATLEAKPDMKSFKVSKQGEGMNTKYIVVALD